MQIDQDIRDNVRDYYGRVVQNTADLKTSACCTPEDLPGHIKSALANIDDEILERFYGCGSPIPLAVEGCTILDLGCGAGRDVYVAAQLVGQSGSVIGVDMTEEQLISADRHADSQMRRFGFATANVDFRYGYIEDLAAAGVADESVDVVISNCVLNLSPDKKAAFEEIFRVLKPGGELFFSDVFADRRIPPSVAADPTLYGECLGGAMYEEDFRRLLEDLGCPDHRVVSTNEIELTDETLRLAAGNIKFRSLTIRSFKLETLEDRCEDYGQIATYLGTIANAPFDFALDDHHVFERGRPMLICGNTAAMLSGTRLADHFKIVGDRSTHFGLFDCEPASANRGDAAAGSCC